MQIRRLDPAEHGQTRRLYETVFTQDEACFVDYYYQYKTRENQIYVAEDEVGTHAMLHLNPYPVRWKGSVKTIYYIVAVATEENYRHRGLMRKLLTASLTDLYEKHAPFIFLMPASEAIYRPFGFRRAWEWRWEEDVILRLNSLPEENFERRNLLMAASVKNVSKCAAEECTEQQLQQLSNYVNSVLEEKFELFTWRTPDYYRNLAREQKASGGKLEVLFENGNVNVPVSACCSAKEKFPPMMARILHLESFIRNICSAEMNTYFWKVQDELLPKNNGLFEITLSPEGGKIRRIDGQDMESNIISRIEEVDISDIPERLGQSSPFVRTFISEVV